MDLQLFFDNFEVIAAAPNGVKKLRELILQLAVRGKLVPQDPADEPAGKLLERILKERKKLILDKKVKPDKDLSPVTVDEFSFELPQNWIATRLGHVLNVIHRPSLWRQTPIPSRHPSPRSSPVSITQSKRLVKRYDGIKA